MKVAVVIPSLANDVTRDYLKLAVESLRKTVEWDIIVVTNGSPHKPDLRDIHGITVHLHTTSQGQCNAVNIGTQIVAPDTDYILVSNDDMYYAPNWHKNLRFDDLCFSPNLIEPADNPGSATPFLKAPAGYTIDKFNQDMVDEKVKKMLSDDEPANRLENGFNLPYFINKELWNTIKGYDTFYDPWGSNSDTDLQTKVELAGVKPRRYRDMLVYHFSNKSGTFDGSHQQEWQKNFDYYTQKWGFNRDLLKSDVWYCKDVLPEDRGSIKYNPPWAWKYENSSNR